MLHIISGTKGKGKTKIILDKANNAIEKATGTIVYIDKSNAHMHELSNKIRLIDATEFPIKSYDAFIGFICGIVASDYDLQELYLDSFLKVANLENQDISAAIEDLAVICKKNDFEITISVSMDSSSLPECASKYIEAAL